MSLDEPVDEAKLRRFWERVHHEARKEFGTDDEGRISKVQVLLIDRSRCEAFHYAPVPYDHRPGADMGEINRTLEMNLEIAHNALMIHLRVQRLRLEQERERLKRKAAQGPVGP